MGQIIRRRAIVEDDWRRLPPEAATFPAQGKLSVPPPLWRVERASLLRRRQALGLWLEADADVETIVEDLWCFEEIAIRIPRFSDGRAFSTARLLRERYGWRGRLRAFGDLLPDQLSDLERVGFDTFELPAGEDLRQTLAAFDEIGEAYQASVTEPLPLFRRRYRDWLVFETKKGSDPCG